MKKILLLLALLIWAGCSDDSGSSVHANGCHEETIHYNEVCDWTNSKYDVTTCEILMSKMSVNDGYDFSTTIEVCE